MATLGPPLQKGEPAPLTVGREVAIADLWKAILEAKYFKGSMHCYANAWIRALRPASLMSFQDCRALGVFLPCLLRAHAKHAFQNGRVRIYYCCGGLGVQGLGFGVILDWNNAKEYENYYIASVSLLPLAAAIGLVQLMYFKPQSEKHVLGPT